MTAIVRFILRLLFRFRGYNTEVLKTPGPVLLIPNHTSWFDWLFVGACLDPDWKFVVSSVTAETSWVHRKIMLNRRTFPIDTNSPYAVKRMAEHLQANGRLVLFAEGRLSRTGTLMKLFEGTGFLLHKTNAKVITCYLRGAQNLPLSPSPAPKKWFPTVTAHFSEILTPPKIENVSTVQARQKLTLWLRDQLVNLQFNVEMEFGANNVLSAIADIARKRQWQYILEDVSRKPLTYRRLLAGTDALSRPLQHALTASGARVGVLMPNVSAVPVILLSLWRLGKVPAILNFSTGIPTMVTCSQLAGLKQIITSRAFLERARLKVEPLTDAGVQFVYLEDLGKQISGPQKFLSLLRVTFNPRSLAPQKTALPSPAPQSAVILFTSGSEGVPKGVELSHTNILANIRQMLAVTDI
ncbi:MAG TPA: AMP-binding protein, partial [Verrucomicrobiae bacterium]|nr:AMP-binding protein [Verrucomicrobiae bacterium]